MRRRAAPRQGGSPSPHRAVPPPAQRARVQDFPRACLFAGLLLGALGLLSLLVVGQDDTSTTFYGVEVEEETPREEDSPLWYLKTICNSTETFYGLSEERCYTINVSLANLTNTDSGLNEFVWQHRGPGIFSTGSRVNRITGKAARPLYGHNPNKADERGVLPHDAMPGYKSPSLGVHGYDEPPTVQRIYPRSGPIEGGTTIHIEGYHFIRQRTLVVKFLWVDEVDIVAARWHNASHISCQTPERDSPQTVLITVSNDGRTWSGYDLATVQASGTWLLFNFTDIIPHGHLTLDNNTGPYLGGTLVMVTIRPYHQVILQDYYNYTYNTTVASLNASELLALGLNDTDPGKTLLVTDQINLFFSTQRRVRYHRFEPSPHLTCKFGDENTDDEFGHHITTVPATWVNYQNIICVSPYTAGRAIDRTVEKTVTVTVSNNGMDYSTVYGSFTYTSIFPRVFHIFTRHDVYTWKARGPFHGMTEVYINGTQFLPSENIVARFTTVPSSRCVGDECIAETKKVTCLFDSYIQIRCITPWWDPYPAVRNPNKTALEPSFLCEVDVSNDGGGLNPSIEPRWSAPNPDRFMYTDIFVSVSGSDVYGDHTPRLPFRTISRAIQAALIAPRAYFIVKGIDVQGAELTGRKIRGKRFRGLNQYVNSDTIVVMDGTYRDAIGIFGYEKNLFLAPYQRMIEVHPENFGNAYIDCEGRTYDHFRPYSRNSIHEFEAESLGAIVFQGIGVFRCSGNTIWEWLDSKRRYRDGTTADECTVNCTNGTQCINGTEYDLATGNKTGNICFDYR